MSAFTAATLHSDDCQHEPKLMERKRIVTSSLCNFLLSHLPTGIFRGAVELMPNAASVLHDSGGAVKLASSFQPKVGSSSGCIKRC